MVLFDLLYTAIGKKIDLIFKKLDFNVVKNLIAVFPDAHAYKDELVWIGLSDCWKERMRLVFIIGILTDSVGHWILLEHIKFAWYFLEEALLKVRFASFKHIEGKNFLSFT